MAFIAPVVAAIGTALGAVGSFVAGLGVLGQAALGIGLSVAASYAQKATAGKEATTVGGTKLTRDYGATVPRQVACGLVGIAGHDCYVNTFGPSNKLLQQIYTLSDYPCDGLSRVAVNGKWATLGAPDGAGLQLVTSGDYAGLIYIRFFDGSQTEAWNALVTSSHPAGRWTAAHIGAGVCWIYVGLVYDEDDLNSFPEFFFELRGARLYDWRKDSSVGGSGPHRWGDPATHEYSDNPAVIEYNYRRGFSYNGDLFCGMGMLADDLPLDKWTAAANLCDETTAYGRRYRCSILLDATAEHGANIASVAMSCGATTVDGVAGSWPAVGHDQPVAITFTDDDLIATAPVRWQARRSMSELVNTVAGTFPSPDDLWSMVDYETQTSSALVTVDRRDRDITVDFPQVTVGEQAAALASIYLKENRYEATATLTLRPRFLVLEPGDWVRWDSARHGSRVYLVKSVALVSLDGEGPRNVQVALEERDGAIYDGISPPPLVQPLAPGAPAYLAEVQSFSVVAILLSGTDGRLLPGLRAAWETIDDATVTGVEVQYFPTAQPDVVISRTVPVSQVVVILSEGVLSATEYRVRTRLVTSPGRPVGWSIGETVTTDAIPDAEVEVRLANMTGDAYAALTRLRSDLDDAVSRVDALARDVAVGFGAQARSLSAAVRAGNAAAAAVLEVRASVETLGGEVTALAEATAAVSASVGDLSAGGLWRIEARAGGGDVSARLVILMRATTGDAWSEVGTVWETGFTGGVPFSRVANYATQYMIIDPYTEDRLPLFATDAGTSTVYMGAAWVKRLDADNITVTGTLSGATGKSGWDFTNDYIWIKGV